MPMIIAFYAGLLALLSLMEKGGANGLLIHGLAIVFVVGRRMQPRFPHRHPETCCKSAA